MTDSTVPTPRERSGLGVSAGDVLSVLGVVVTVVAGLLVYFGWTRNAALSSALGYSESALAHSPQDYVLRSVPTVYKLTLGLGLLAVLAGAARATMLVAAARARARPFVVWLCHTTRAAGLLAVLAIAAALATGRVPVPTEAVIAITVAALVTESTLGRLRETDGERPRLPQAVIYGGLIAVLVLAVFSKTEQLATEEGRTMAVGMATDPAAQAVKVVVYAAHDLNVSGPGVQRTVINSSDGAYHFRYDGLLLYVYNDHRFFLVPSGWRGAGDGPWRMPIVILADTTDIRVEFVS